MNHLSSRRSLPLVAIMLLTSSLELLTVPSFAQTQTSPSLTSHAAQSNLNYQDSVVAIAKLHYENAVAAISNNDWKTAKSELLKAKQLAPSNALVHYDLALAYSHTGETHSAQLELNNALRLGLPPAQQEEAKELKSKWAANSAAVHSQKATQQNATTPDAVSLDETLEFIKSKINGSSISGDLAISDNLGHGILTFSYEDIQFTRPRMSIEYAVRGQRGEVSTLRMYLQNLDLSELSLGSSKLVRDASMTYLSISFNKPQAVDEYSASEGRSREYRNNFMIAIQDVDTGQRLLKAFEHAAELCGAKQDPF